MHNSLSVAVDFGRLLNLSAADEPPAAAPQMPRFRYIHNAQKRKEYAGIIDQGMDTHGVSAMRDKVLALRDSLTRAREAAAGACSTRLI